MNLLNFAAVLIFPVLYQVFGNIRELKFKAAYSTHTHDMACGSRYSDAFRHTVVNNINAYRSLIANGSAPNKCGLLPGAKNMYKIVGQNILKQNFPLIIA